MWVVVGDTPGQKQAGGRKGQVCTTRTTAYLQEGERKAVGFTGQEPQISQDHQF